MAENLYSNYINQEVLHTNSGFIIGKNFNLNISDSTLDLDEAIRQAQTKESQFYAKFGKNSYDEFIQAVRNEFIDNQKDRSALNNFTYRELSKTLKNLVDQTSHEIHKQEDYELTILIKNNAPKEVEKILRPGKKKDGPNSNWVIGKIEEGIGETITSIGVNDEKLVSLLNLARKQIPKKVKDETGKVTTTFMPAGRKHGDAIAAGNMKAKEIEIMKKLESLMDKDASWLSIGLKKQGEKTTLSEMFTEDRVEKNFPWGYTPTQIRELLKDGQHRQKLNKAFLLIKNYVLHTLGQPSSPELSKAFHIVWDRKIGPILSQDLAFFERGGIGDPLKGALGEFQAAAMLELFNIKYGASNAKSIARITGDTDSTAGLADVVAFESFGVQVKNFNEFGNTKNVNATTNPALLTKYFDNKNVAQDVRIFLANYFFNDTFKKEMDEGKKFINLSNDISQLHYALLSLSVSDADQRVSFYTISGKYFVPASEILTAIKKGQTDFTYKGITSENTIHKTDDQFKADKNKLAKQYWKSNNSDGRVYYTPTKQNYTSYNNLVGNSITIKSSFDYRKILGEVATSRYTLY